MHYLALTQHSSTQHPSHGETYNYASCYVGIKFISTDTSRAQASMNGKSPSKEQVAGQDEHGSIVSGANKMYGAKILYVESQGLLLEAYIAND